MMGIDRSIKWGSDGSDLSSFTSVEFCYLWTKILGVASGKHNVPTTNFKLHSEENDKQTMIETTMIDHILWIL